MKSFGEVWKNKFYVVGVLGSLHSLSAPFPVDILQITYKINGKMGAVVFNYAYFTSKPKVTSCLMAPATLASMLHLWLQDIVAWNWNGGCNELNCTKRKAFEMLQAGTKSMILMNYGSFEVHTLVLGSTGTGICTRLYMLGRETLSIFLVLLGSFQSGSMLI